MLQMPSPLLPGLPGQSPTLQKKQALPQFLFPLKLVFTMCQRLCGDNFILPQTQLFWEKSADEGKLEEETLEATLVVRSHWKARRRASCPRPWRRHRGSLLCQSPAVQWGAHPPQCSKGSRATSSSSVICASKNKRYKKHHSFSVDGKISDLVPHYVYTDCANSIPQSEHVR